MPEPRPEHVNSGNASLWRKCEHGPKTRRFGKSTAGTLWAAYMCQDHVCDPEWIAVPSILFDWANEKPEWWQEA